MQRRRRQHESERPQSGRDRIGKLFGAAGVEEHDWRCGAGEKCSFIVHNSAIAPNDIEIARHQRERLSIAMFEFPEPLHHIGARRIAGELIAAKALDSDDLTLLDETESPVDIVQHRRLLETYGFAVEADEASLWAARMAGRRLGMKAPICGIGVFRRANRAEIE